MKILYQVKPNIRQVQWLYHYQNDQGEISKLFNKEFASHQEDITMLKWVYPITELQK